MKQVDARFLRHMPDFSPRKGNEGVLQVGCEQERSMDQTSK